MTREQLQEANKLNHAITELENQLQIVESMLHGGENLWISDHDNGEVLLSSEARLDVINTVLSDINYRRENLEDQLRMM